MPINEDSVGSVVRFYRDGWRCGHLEELNGACAMIRPIGGGANKRRLAKIPLCDVEEMEQPLHTHSVTDETPAPGPKAAE